MRFRFIGATILFSATLVASNAAAGVLMPIAEVPGSVPHSTEPWGLNDAGTIIGAYVGSSDQSFHGFVGKPNGPYTLFDAGPNGTNPRGINNAGWIVGITNADNCATGAGPGPFGCVEFERSPSGTVTPITVNGAQAYSIAQGINSSGVFVGDYHAPDATREHHSNGYFGYQAAWTADLTLPFPTFITAPRSINDRGEAVGWFLLVDGSTHGFVLQNSVVTVVDFPGSDTFLTGVNDQGMINGTAIDADGNGHPFLLSSDLGTFTPISVPGATSASSFHINNLGEVAISSDIGGFLYCSNDNDHRCSGANASTASAQALGVRHPAFTSRPCAHNGCFYPAGTPRGSFMPLGGRFPATAPNARMKAFMRIQ